MQLLVIPDSTTLSYWLNWRVLLCAIWVFTPLVVAIYIIWKYERLNHFKSSRGNTHQEIARSSYGNAAWRPFLDCIHPIWLLAYRVIALSLLLATTCVKISISGFGVYFFYYTQWTFTLLTIYFGFGALLSIYGCFQYYKMGTDPDSNTVVGDAELGNRVPLLNGEITSVPEKKKILHSQKEICVFNAGSIINYLFQVIYQTCGGAVMLTDVVYWSIIFPYFTIRDYNMNLMTVNLHSLNAVLLLIDTALNHLSFPWFRISYFILWTGAFVIFQWIFHACVKMRWPYPFLELSSPFAPLWYLLIATMHIPCYGIFVLIHKVKHYFLSKWFPESYSV